MTQEPRWRAGALDRRAKARAEYRRTAPGLLEIGAVRCAVRDLGVGGLRVEPVPPVRIWTVGQQVDGELLLRTGGRLAIAGQIARIDRGGLAIFPIDDRWPAERAIDDERTTLLRGHRERRGAPRLPLPISMNAATALRDVSETGLRYALLPSETPPPVGTPLHGALRIDAETVIEVRGRVVRHVDREIALALDPPGLSPEVIAMLRGRFFTAASPEA